MSNISTDNKDIEEILSNETTGLGIDAIVFQSTKGTDRVIIAKSPFTISLQFEDIPRDAFYLSSGAVLSWEAKQFAMAITALDENTGIYLLVAKSIDPDILDHRYKIKGAIHEYTSLSAQRTGLKITFMTFFSGIILLLLALVVLVGVLFANRLIKPINNLICAARNVSLGDYNSPIAISKFNNELDILISAFNIMIIKLEEQRKELAISHRQNAWRDIAKKIAHEIKNPLTPIQLAAERLKRKYDIQITTDRDVFVICIDTIIRQVQCIGTLVKEFSDFARMPEPKLENIDLIQLIRETVLLQSSSHKAINFHVNLNNNTTCCCYVDPSQITQVIMNLLQNAVNSITENKGYGDIYVGLHKDLNNAIINIEDNGPGFTTVALEHALDPYFTTRESGTGLGLAVVYKIVLEHGGQIEISNSKVVGGASVKIVLPSKLV
jgi:two-component system nitrogen regulation sensor histidine kinase NtrY